MKRTPDEICKMRQSAGLKIMILKQTIRQMEEALLLSAPNRQEIQKNLECAKLELISIQKRQHKLRGMGKRAFFNIPAAYR